MEEEDLLYLQLTYLPIVAFRIHIVFNLTSAKFDQYIPLESL